MEIDKAENRIDWNAIRAEYISGGTSYRKLCEKYGCSFMTLKTKAKKEGWTSLRTHAEHEANTKAIERVAEVAADNATLAAEIQRNLLMRLKRIEERFPLDATEIRTQSGKNTVIFRLRDITSAYKELTENIQTNDNASNALLQSLMDLERKYGND